MRAFALVCLLGLLALHAGWPGRGLPFALVAVCLAPALLALIADWRGQRTLAALSALPWFCHAVAELFADAAVFAWLELLLTLAPMSAVAVWGVRGRRRARKAAAGQGAAAEPHQ